VTSDTWSCSACTYAFNPLSFLACQVCHTELAIDRSGVGDTQSQDLALDLEATRVVDATGCAHQDAERALEQCGGRVDDAVARVLSQRAARHTAAVATGNSACVDVDTRLCFAAMREVMLAELTQFQRAALEKVTALSQEASQAAEAQLLSRFESLRPHHGAWHLAAVLTYIREVAGIIIHVKIESLIDPFLASTHYRNLFEIGRGSGCIDQNQRRMWEDRIFHKAYAVAAPEERVKYGVFNVCNDPMGVASCRQYGDSFFLLKNDRVRLRTTFANCDSSATTSVFGTVEYYAHVLAKFTDHELVHLTRLANGEVFGYEMSG
jgi:hypothetical protein